MLEEARAARLAIKEPTLMTKVREERRVARVVSKSHSPPPVISGSFGCEKCSGGQRLEIDSESGVGTCVDCEDGGKNGRELK
jgi:hypothetical protein